MKIQKNIAVTSNAVDTTMMNGTYEGWREIAKEAVKYKLPAFAMISAFAKTVAQILEMQTLLVNFYGHSAVGKTLLLQLVTSIHGNTCNTGVGNSAIQKWNSPSVFMSALDELHMVSDKEFSNLIFKLVGDIDKMRSKGKYPKPQWFSADEQILGADEQLVAHKLNKTSNLTISLMDIHIKSQLFTDFEGNELASLEAKKLATKLKAQCALHYGHAGLDFNQQLSNLADSKALIQQDVQVMLEKLADGIELVPEIYNTMKMLAMIAVSGNYAVQFGILPMTQQNVFDAVAYVRDLYFLKVKRNNSKR
jgi:hypothetical protein